MLHWSFSHSLLIRCFLQFWLLTTNTTNRQPSLIPLLPNLPSSIPPLWDVTVVPTCCCVLLLLSSPPDRHPGRSPTAVPSSELVPLFCACCPLCSERRGQPPPLLPSLSPRSRTEPPSPPPRRSTTRKKSIAVTALPRYTYPSPPGTPRRRGALADPEHGPVTWGAARPGPSAQATSLTRPGDPAGWQVNTEAIIASSSSVRDQFPLRTFEWGMRS